MVVVVEHRYQRLACPRETPGRDKRGIKVSVSRSTTKSGIDRLHNLRLGGDIDQRLCSAKDGVTTTRTSPAQRLPTEERATIIIMKTTAEWQRVTLTMVFAGIFIGPPRAALPP